MVYCCGKFCYNQAIIQGKAENVMKKILTAALLAFIAALCACSGQPAATESTTTAEADAAVTETTEAAPADGCTLYADFANGLTEEWMFSDGWSNGSMFNCTWRKNNGVFEDGVLKMSIDEFGDGYSGCELRTNDFYGYGMYEVSMKPIKNIGVVSSFFTYTGPSDNNPWDEIDIEFLGKDTTKVQFNYFTNGKGNHEYVYDLGFDASEEFHSYGFKWAKDSITWYVDGEEVYTAAENIPSTPSKIMMNVWNGIGVDGWLGAYDGTAPITAQYKTASFTAEE